MVGKNNIAIAWQTDHEVFIVGDLFFDFPTSPHVCFQKCVSLRVIAMLCLSVGGSSNKNPSGKQVSKKHPLEICRVHFLTTPAHIIWCRFWVFFETLETVCDRHAFLPAKKMKPAAPQMPHRWDWWVCAWKICFSDMPSP